MGAKKEDIQRLIAAHKVRQDEARLAMEKIKALLAKADIRRHREPQNVRRWNEVLDHLEASLDEARSRIESGQLEAQRLQSMLRDIQFSGKTDEEINLGSFAGQGSAPPSAGNTERALLNASFLELGKFSLEQIALVQSNLMEENSARTAAAEQLLGRVELANQVRDEGAAATNASTANYERRQLLLRTAIDKIQTNRVDTMTGEEVRLVISCHSLLSRRLRPTPKDERLVRILSAAIKVLQRKHAESRKGSSWGA